MNTKETIQDIKDRFPNGTKVSLKKNIGSSDSLPRKGEIGNVDKVDADGLLWVTFENGHQTGFSCSLVDERLELI